jgi:glycosyltransferase involved in cell wall biosynthesis
VTRAPAPASTAEELDLTVIIPAHDAASYLGAALDSVFAELPDRSEVIVVDDGSRDGTPEILARYAPRIRVLTNPVARGAGSARNLAAAQARGRVLAFHDADDLVLPGRFRLLLDVLDRSPEVDLAFGNGRRMDASGRLLKPVIARRYVRRLRRRVGIAELLEGSWAFLQGMCIRRARFAELGGFTRELAEDWELTLRAALRCELRYVDRPLFLYRRHDACVTAREAEFADVVVAMLEEFVATHPEVYAIAGRGAVGRALAKRLARAARHRERAGDVGSAACLLDRAIALAPGMARYRWRRVKLRWSALRRRRVAQGGSAS